MVPLHSAALFGHLEVVEALIQSGADVNVRVVPKKAKIISATVTPLHFAFRSGHNSTVEILIAKVDINFATPLRNCSTPLHAAAQGGHVKVVEILLEHGAVVSTVDDQNRTPLDIAVLGGSLEIVKMLFKQDEIYINGKDSEGWTMLEHASRGGNVELVKFLVANGADINVANHNTLTGTKPIHTAAADGRTNILEFFLECGMSVHEVDYDGQTPLHYAAEFGKHEMVNYLITRGADVNYKNYMGWMPIHNAASDEHEETVKVLLQNGAIYDAIDIYGNTPLGITGHQGVKSLLKSTDDLFAAMTENNCARVKELIAEGAIIDAKQSVVGAPILYAAWQGYNDIIDCLLENGANPNSTNVTGFTPLHCAVKNSQYKATVALLHKGAIYNCANIEKLTPLDFATDEKIIELLDMIDKTFRKVDSRDTTVISDLRKITDREIVKAIMRACSRKRESLMVTAINNSFPAIEDLEKIFQDDTLVNESQT
ncbi:unnamed protein product [Bemisia tabaci]|uniref:Uncharacterized protein n=2 Tax=Bemisia tabaci TaxID=7038 RepID=A0A9P0ANG5_BEMTA|nr:unnamed protein product [Bemisia tabaci]